MSIAIEINGLTKRFKNHKAVDNISVSIPKGEIFGLIGPNG
ncbi:MAG: ABC transporter ATP-binding protein, partial [Tissierellia bacterium]|nr:ABC transporter ATP-binding protein [Tissierellia bacterium]